MGQEQINESQWSDYDRRVLFGIVGLLGVVLGVVLIAVGATISNILLMLIGSALILIE